MGLFDLFSDRNERAGRDAAVRGLRTGEERARGDIATGLGDVRGRFGEAQGQLEPFTEAFNPAAGTFAGALGLGGDEGRQAAVNAFQTSPGFEFATDRALDAVERRASSRGDLAGGATREATASTVHGLANQEYQRFLDNLLRASDRGQQAAGDRASMFTGLGDRELGVASGLGDLAFRTETGVGDADREFELGKDATGANIFTGITTGLSLGARLLGA